MQRISRSGVQTVVRISTGDVTILHIPKSGLYSTQQRNVRRRTDKRIGRSDRLTLSCRSSLPEIQQLLSEPAMDVMLLCHSLTPQDCAEALIITHERWPHIQTIALVSGFSDHGSEAADSVMEVSEGPAKLIRAVRSRLN